MEKTLQQKLLQQICDEHWFPLLLTPEIPQFQNLDFPPNDDLSVCEGILNPPPEPTWTKQVA